MTKLIGIAGLAGSGKTTLAEAIKVEAEKRKLTCQILPLAYPLKAMIADIVSHYLHMNYEEVFADLNDSVRKERYRTFMQSFGTDVCRTIDPDYWIKKFAEHTRCSEYNLTLVPDVRFQNEISYIKARHGEIIYVERSGLLQTDDHISENSVTKHAASWAFRNTYMDNLQDFAEFFVDELGKIQ